MTGMSYMCMWAVSASNAYCLASAVSSRLLEAIATAEGVNFEVRLVCLGIFVNTSNCSSL